MSADGLYLVGGISLLLAVALPVLLERVPLSAPIVLVAVGAAVGLLPMPGGEVLSPIEHRAIAEHLTEFTVIVALFGVGLALDRPLRFTDVSTWRTWATTWRLLAVTMPLTIAAVAVLGWWAMGLGPASALLLGAVMAPTDPVLASDVQVEGPSVVGPAAGPEPPDQGEGPVDAGETGESGETADGDDPGAGEDPGAGKEPDEVRFALTSEAGLNDGLAFPFVYAAVFAATLGPVAEWGWRWLAWDLVGKVVLGVLVGAAVGWGLASLAFRARTTQLRFAESGEPLLALAAILMSYGAAELIGGWGFLAVFASGIAMRSAERSHHYHELMHRTVENLERLLTLLILLLLGIALTQGVLNALTWGGAVVGAALVLVVRPLAGLVGMAGARHGHRRHRLLPRETAATAFFGVRGVGSLYYLAYGTGAADFEQDGLLWSTVAFTVVFSVVVHGVTATPAMEWLERRRGPGVRQ